MNRFFLKKQVDSFNGTKMPNASWERPKPHKGSNPVQTHKSFRAIVPL